LGAASHTQMRLLKLRGATNTNKKAGGGGVKSVRARGKPREKMGGGGGVNFSGGGASGGEPTRIRGQALRNGKRQALVAKTEGFFRPIVFRCLGGKKKNRYETKRQNQEVRNVSIAARGERDQTRRSI